ncbi:PAS domain-containing protein [Candidatus Saccharibacteria bacterium]|nr:PAS domain-containing protein [Candidatus Saccharibacteria bacterium]
MGILNLKIGAKKGGTVEKPVDNSAMAQLALNTIHDGVVIVNKDAVIRFINPAAVEMTGCGSANNATNLDFSLIMKFEMKDGAKVEDADNAIIKAIKTNQAFESRDFVLLAGQDEKKTPIAIYLTPSGDARSDRIITFRNISKELEEEGAQTEFVSTASHEMRTPVASIEGYIGLALNPQTATIDARARQYLEAAHSSSQHLGRLFKDLLDVTKLDDHRIRPHPIPLELNGFVKKFADEYATKFSQKRIKYSFGAGDAKQGLFGGRVLEQVVYTYADPDFLGEILANLIENAIKYTPEGGAVWVNVQGDGDRALINVTDTGIGIASEDLQHIFQKFYRADNSHTRTVGGTGLGLYLVKQRTEAMNGRVWAESAFGEGSTFYVSLPRLTGEEYEKRQLALQNQKAVAMFQDQVKTAEDIAAQNATGAAVGIPTQQFDLSLVQQQPVVAQPTMAAPIQQAPVQPAVAQQQISSRPAPIQQQVPVQPIQPVQPQQIQTQPVQPQPIQPQPAPFVQPAPIQQPIQTPQQPPTVQYGQLQYQQPPVQNNQNIIQ